MTELEAKVQDAERWYATDSYFADVDVTGNPMELRANRVQAFKRLIDKIIGETNHSSRCQQIHILIHGDPELFRYVQYHHRISESCIPSMDEEDLDSIANSLPDTVRSIKNRPKACY